MSACAFCASRNYLERRPIEFQPLAEIGCQIPVIIHPTAEEHIRNCVNICEKCLNKLIKDGKRLTTIISGTTFQVDINGCLHINEAELEFSKTIKSTSDKVVNVYNKEKEMIKHTFENLRDNWVLVKTVFGKVYLCNKETYDLFMGTYFRSTVFTEIKDYWKECVNFYELPPKYYVCNDVNDLYEMVKDGIW